MLKDLNEVDFEQEIMNSDKPVVVDFWAPWCGPCKMMSPVIETLSDKYDGKASFAKVNIDNNNRLAGSLGISSIPTVVVFSGGKAVDGFVGFRPQQDVESIIDKHIL